jgi:5-methylcytosine-specific restriction endonuclease McrA
MIYKSTKKQLWEERFLPKLKLMHANHAKKIFHRLMKKSSTLKSSLKRRSKEYEVKCNVTLDEIRTLFYKAYGKPCRYCKRCLDISNIVCDHHYPISMGGDSSVRNLQIICNSCNTRKGSLKDKDYRALLAFLNKHPDMKSYVLRKLAKGDNFNK